MLRWLDKILKEQMSDPINNRPKTSSGKRVQELDDFDDDDLLPE